MTKFSTLALLLLTIICVLLGVITIKKRQVQKHDPLEKNVPPLPSLNRPTNQMGNVLRAPGREYFIDNITGNNRYAGTSRDKSWKNFNRLKKHTFIPGSKILLKRGSVWHQTLFIPNGGTKDAPIIVDAFGTGPPPVIDLENRYPTGIRINSSHIIIQNIVLKNAKKTCVDIAVSCGFNNITLKKLEILNSGKNGIGVFKGGRGLTISQCRIYDSRNNGIYLGGSPQNRLSHVTVSDCHIRGTNNNDGITIHEDEASNPAGTFFHIKNNLSEMCAEQGFDITSGDHVMLEGNRSSRNLQGGIMVAHSARNVTIKNHISTDEPRKKMAAAVILAGDHGNIRLMNSVIKGDGYHLLLVKTNNIAVSNNTFIWDGGKSPIDIEGTIENLYFLNNIVYSKQNRMGRIRFLEASRPPDYPSFHFDYNLYHVPQHKMEFYHGNKNYEFTAFQKTFKVEENSLNTDPVFSDPANDDYRLSQGSPAVDSGCPYTSVLHASKDDRRLMVKNTIFFYATPGVDPQCIMLDKTHPSFRVEKVDYTTSTLILNKTSCPIERQQAVSACYFGNGIDIGAFERRP